MRVYPFSRVSVSLAPKNLNVHFLRFQPYQTLNDRWTILASRTENERRKTEKMFR